MIQLTRQDAMPPPVAHGRNTTSRPASVPVRKLSDGAPKGVLTLTHFWPANPSMLDKGRCPR